MVILRIRQQICWRIRKFKPNQYMEWTLFGSFIPEAPGTAACSDRACVESRRSSAPPLGCTVACVESRRSSEGPLGRGGREGSEKSHARRKHFWGSVKVPAPSPTGSTGIRIAETRRILKVRGLKPTLLETDFDFVIYHL